MGKLKSCPFCGGMGNVEVGTDGARIKCLCCGASTEYYEDIPMTLSPGGMGNLNDFRVVNKGSYGVNLVFERWNNRV